VEGLSPKGQAAAAGKPVDGPSGQPKDADLKASTLVVLGADNPGVNRLLFGEGSGEGFSIRSGEPLEFRQGVGIFHARSAEEAVPVPESAALRKYSRWASDKGRNRTSDRCWRGGIVLALREEPVVIDLSLLRSSRPSSRARQANASVRSEIPRPVQQPQRHSSSSRRFTARPLAGRGGWRCSSGPSRGRSTPM